MRSISILVLALGFAVCLVHAVAAASDLPQQLQTAAEADCLVAMPATANGRTDRLANPACQASVTPRLAQRRPGFWTSDQVRPGSGENEANPQPAVLRAADSSAPAGAPACQSYPLPVVVGGQSLQATVVACPQPDGSWRATQYTPGLPPQIYTVPPPPAAGGSPNGYASPNDYASPGYYQDWGPDWAGGPWFWGFAPAVVVVQRFHFFHGFNHGFAHGFAHGFVHGFAHGGAAGHGFGGMHR
jgi:surface antigen